MPRIKAAVQPKATPRAKYTDRTGRRNPRARPTDPDTGEVLIGVGEAPQTGATQTPGGTGHHSPDEKALYIQKAEQALKWQQLKNEKAEKELQAKLGNLVELEVIKRQVIAANQIVKQQILAVIERANLSHTARAQLKKEMIAALNELAYEHAHTIHSR